jgi:hypothetical protein
MKIRDTLRSIMADALTADVQGGAPPATLEFRTGPAPVNTTDPDSGTKLATLTFSNPAFPAAVNGVLTASPITPDASADATGSAGHFRIKRGGGSTVILQGTCGVDGADIVFPAGVEITLGGTVSISSLTITVPAGSS